MHLNTQTIFWILLMLSTLLFQHVLGDDTKNKTVQIDCNPSRFLLTDHLILLIHNFFLTFEAYYYLLTTCFVQNKKIALKYILAYCPPPPGQQIRISRIRHFNKVCSHCRHATKKKFASRNNWKNNSPFTSVARLFFLFLKLSF